MTRTRPASAVSAVPPCRRNARSGQFLLGLLGRKRLTRSGHGRTLEPALALSLQGKCGAAGQRWRRPIREEQRETGKTLRKRRKEIKERDQRKSSGNQIEEGPGAIAGFKCGERTGRPPENRGPTEDPTFSFEAHSPRGPRSAVMRAANEDAAMSWKNHRPPRGLKIQYPTSVALSLPTTAGLAGRNDGAMV